MIDRLRMSALLVSLSNHGLRMRGRGCLRSRVGASARDAGLGTLDFGVDFQAPLELACHLGTGMPQLSHDAANLTRDLGQLGWAKHYEREGQNQQQLKRPHPKDVHATNAPA